MRRGKVVPLDIKKNIFSLPTSIASNNNWLKIHLYFSVFEITYEWSTNEDVMWKQLNETVNESNFHILYSNNCCNTLHSLSGISSSNHNLTNRVVFCIHTSWPKGLFLKVVSHMKKRMWYCAKNKRTWNSYNTSMRLVFPQYHPRFKKPFKKVSLKGRG